MKIKCIKESYVNTSQNIYDSDYICLANIKDDKIAFDKTTLFLSEERKRELNAEEIKKNLNCVYLFKNKNAYGLIANLSLEEYQNNNIKSHELVYPNIIQGMVNNIYHYNAEANPVFITYDKKIDLKTFIDSNKYTEKYTFPDLELYAFNDKTAEEIIDNFKDIQTMYVADGHHRLYSSLFSKNKRTILTCFMSFDQVKIQAIHRLIRNVDASNFEMAKSFINQYLEIKNDMPLSRGHVRITYQNKSFIVKLKDGDDDLFWNNDVYKVNTQIITTAFRTQNLNDVEFIRDYDLHDVKKRLSNNDVLIEMKPLKISQFIDLANKNYILPPKSTCFTPKFPSFLVFKKYK
ncbi:Uncharacterized conserved protein [Mycoplasmopsis californica]|uniref:DUF1015 family protein n=1 Tax=Mycoplasmopsis equigenitalium TaxID=114883 RepID=A0ABY5J520_9BACT|nr:DUF1015 family protein [Mycoplasmopsis equigenitalium]UUD36803.1 DUF1015 family protein [Mycoplasmopsis equigenitalium]VEU69899.1 Uncharacterized conserved protein [Mycoplasmopsis californica]